MLSSCSFAFFLLLLASGCRTQNQGMSENLSASRNDMPQEIELYTESSPHYFILESQNGEGSFLVYEAIRELGIKVPGKKAISSGFLVKNLNSSKCYDIFSALYGKNTSQFKKTTTLYARIAADQKVVLPLDAKCQYVTNKRLKSETGTYEHTFYIHLNAKKSLGLSPWTPNEQQKKILDFRGVPYTGQMTKAVDAGTVVLQDGKTLVDVIDAFHHESGAPAAGGTNSTRKGCLKNSRGAPRPDLYTYVYCNVSRKFRDSCYGNIVRRQLADPFCRGKRFDGPSIVRRCMEEDAWFSAQPAWVKEGFLMIFDQSSEKYFTAASSNHVIDEFIKRKFPGVPRQKLKEYKRGVDPILGWKRYQDRYLWQPKLPSEICSLKECHLTVEGCG